MKIKYFIFFIILFLFIHSGEISASGDENKQKGAKEVVALSNEIEMKNAIEIAYIDIDYYVSLENLNDLLNSNPVKSYDDINEQGGTPVIDLATGLFKPILADLTKSPTVWLGPYINYQPAMVSDNGAGYDKGTPIDPWYRPYYFFSPMGLIRSDSKTITQEIYGDYFDRYAIVSLGSDGIKSSDDIITLFGAPPTKTVMSSLSKNEAQPGEQITIKGYNFGAGTKLSKTGERIFLNGIQITDIISWSDRNIVIRLPDDAQSGYIKIIINGQESNQLYLDIIPAVSRINTPWELYQ